MAEQPQPIAYEDKHDTDWEKNVARLGWKRNEEFSGVVLEGDCPVCRHPNAINVFVTTVGASLFLKGGPAATPREFVACQCVVKHPGGPDKAGAGCGRWGYVPVSLPKASGAGEEGSHA